MKKTDFSPATLLFVKNITRFAPAWGCFTGYLLIRLFFSRLFSFSLFPTNMDSWNLAPMIAAYGFGIAVLLFGDLYKGRMCNALHALPISRSTWFWVNLASGTAMFLVPYLITMFLALMMGLGCTIPGGAYVPAVLFLLGSMQYLFFFGLSILCVLLAGNLIGAGLLYVLLNTASLLLCWLVDQLYVSGLYGIVVDSTPFAWGSPFFKMVNTLYVNYDYSSRAVIYDGTSFIYPLICALVGLALMGLGLVLYKKRRLESAGDLLAVSGWRIPVVAMFCLIPWGIYGPVAGIVGFFFGWMLIKKTVSVFTPKNLLACALTVAAIGGSIGIVKLDPLGLENRVPRQEQIHSIDMNINYYYNSNFYPEYRVMQNPELTAAVLDCHRSVAALRDTRHALSRSSEDILLNWNVEYRLQNGKTLRRSYPISGDCPSLPQLTKTMSRVEFVLGISQEDLQAFAHQLAFINIGDQNVTDPAQIDALIQAIAADCAQGTMAQNNLFHDADWITSLKFYFNPDQQETSFWVNLYVDSVNTVAWLAENGFLPQEQP